VQVANTSCSAAWQWSLHTRCLGCSADAVAAADASSERDGDLIIILSLLLLLLLVHRLLLLLLAGAAIHISIVNSSSTR
jgi:hypothetical protein